jgi:hypothetical protein
MTTKTSGGSSPDAAQTAAKEIEARAGAEDAPRGRGRPPGSRTKKATKKTTAKAPDPITPEEVQGYALLGGTLWTLAARIFKMEDLTPEERTQLGEAMAPVARKYIPMLDEYAPEATLLILVAGLVQSKQKKKPKTGEPDLELVPPGGDDGDEAR